MTPMTTVSLLLLALHPLQRALHQRALALQRGLPRQLRLRGQQALNSLAKHWS